MVRTRSIAKLETLTSKEQNKPIIKKIITKLKSTNNISSIISDKKNDYYTHTLSIIKRIEKTIIHAVFCNNYNSVIINSDYIKNYYMYDYNNIIFVINFYVLTIQYIEYIKKKLKLCSTINYESAILTIELDNLYKDYHNINNYKNKFILDKTINSSSYIDEDIIIKHFILLNYCNSHDLYKSIKYIPLEDI
jgi:hypothetical protein